MSEFYESEIALAARIAKVDPALIDGIVRVESAYNPWAFRYEFAYRYLVNVTTGRPFRKLTDTEAMSYNPPSDFLAPALPSARAEWMGQKTSWGLMQVMGAVARELGFGAPYLTELCRPDLGLYMGASLLRRLIVAQGNDEDEAIQAYNAGIGGIGSPKALAYLAKVKAAAGR